MNVANTEQYISSEVARPSVAANGWHPAGTPVRVLYVSMLLLFGALMAAGLIGYATFSHPANDYFAFNSFSRFIRCNEPALIYDQARLRTFQNLPGHKVFAFMYPPGMLLLVWPLASLAYGLGYVMWLGVGIAASIAILAIRRDGWPLALLLVVTPSTLWTILCGQSTFLLAALVVGGLLMTRSRPLTAGVLLGLATYKPQLGLLVPVALLAARQWQTIFAAAMTFLAVVIVTTVGFGTSIWLAWLSHFGSIMDVRTHHAADWAPLLSTVASDLSTLGTSQRAADIGQAASTALATGCVWWCFRQPVGQTSESTLRLQVAALGVATFLATPFAFIYDLPVFTLSLLLFVDERRLTGDAFCGAEILVIVAGLLAPVAFLIDGAHSCGTVVVLVVCATIVRRLRYQVSSIPGKAIGVRLPLTA